MGNAVAGQNFQNTNRDGRLSKKEFKIADAKPMHENMPGMTCDQALDRIKQELKAIASADTDPQQRAQHHANAEYLIDGLEEFCSEKEIKEHGYANIDDAKKKLRGQLLLCLKQGNTGFYNKLTNPFMIPNPAGGWQGVPGRGAVQQL